jgi:hypothetical protein
MTTFTMQDLNNIEVTKEEEEAMQVMEKQMGEVLPNKLPNTTPDINTIINNICTQLQLLSTVIKEGAEKREGDPQSLQDCVGSVLESAQWFREMVAERVEELVGDVDFDSEIESKVDDWFRTSFSFDDYVDVSSELESKVEEVVEDKLRNASISVDF